MPDYFTYAELRALPDMGDATKYTDARIDSAAAEIVAIIEREVGTSFIYRTATEVLSGAGEPALFLASPYVAAISSISVGNVVTDVTTVYADHGILRYTSGASWTTGVRNVTVTYTAGYSATPPADVKQAALWGTRARLLEQGQGSLAHDRATSISNDAGGTTSYVLAGEDRPTGYPRVDATILGWKKRLSSFGFA